MTRQTQPVVTICLVCGATRELPPSKAKSARYCGTECRSIGARVRSAWGRLGYYVETEGRIPYYFGSLGPDPEDRFRHVGKRWFKRTKEAWEELLLDGSDWIIDRRAIPALDVPIHPLDQPES